MEVARCICLLTIDPACRKYDWPVSATATGLKPCFASPGAGRSATGYVGRLQRLLPLLRNDAKIDVQRALRGLMITEVHIIIRFDRYGRYPYKLWLICKKCNPKAYRTEIVVFLETDDEKLYVGYSLQLTFC